MTRRAATRQMHYTKARTKKRVSDQRFYCRAVWKRLRTKILNGSPLCVACEKRGLLIPATEVDHVIPRSARPDLAFEISNLQTLCTRCHAAKTVRESTQSVKQSIVYRSGTAEARSSQGEGGSMP